jgi:hypothetical protein
MKKLTKEQGIVLTGFTGKSMCHFWDFHEDVEKRLGRPIWTHQFADKELWKEIKEAYRKDFENLCGLDQYEQEGQ